MPVGFKNATDGSLQIAVDACTQPGAPRQLLIDQDSFTPLCAQPAIRTATVLRASADQLRRASIREAEAG
jgi:phospho-2-dehydro-3-deoxyheptonate aldolase